MDKKALEIINLNKSYGKNLAVSEINFEINIGEVFGLLGPNGAGKTTIISSIVTLQETMSGSIKVFGFDTSIDPRKTKSYIGFVPQELINHGFFTVEEIIYFHANLYGIKVDKQYLLYLLEKLQLYEHRRKLVSQLSGGMKRRLLIIKALIHRPKLLLLDEPTAGVDVELRASLWKFIQELKKENISILLTTHYLEEAERLCDRIGILDKGKLKRINNTEKLLEEHSSKKVTFILTKPLPQISHPLITGQGDHYLDFLVPNGMPISQLISDINISYEILKDVNIKVGTLEDVMENILKL